MANEQDLQLLASAMEDVKYLHTKSFGAFSASWTRYHEQREYPLEKKENSPGEHDVQAIVDAGLGQRFANEMNQFVAEFVINTVAPRLHCETNPEEFLNLFIQFGEFMDSIFVWLLRAFPGSGTILVPGCDHCYFSDVCVVIALTKLYEIVKQNLQDAIFESLSALRNNYPYSSSWMYERFGADCLYDITLFIDRYVENNDETQDLWWNSIKPRTLDHVNEYLENLPNVCERDYLTFAKHGIKVETNLLRCFPGSNRERLGEIERILKETAWEEHMNRSVRSLFFTAVDIVAEKESDFDKYMLENVIYMRMGSKYEESLVKQLKSDVRFKFLEIVMEEEGSINDNDTKWPLSNFRDLLERLFDYENTISRRLRKRTEKFPVLKEAIEEISVNLFDVLATTEFYSKVVVAQEKLCDVLCGNEEITEWGCVGTFFKFLPKQVMLMSRLEKFARNAPQDDQGALRNLKAFCELDEVKDHVPDSLSELLRDLVPAVEDAPSVTGDSEDAEHV